MENQNMKNNWKNLGIFFSVSTFVPLFLGFYKMFAYENGDYSWSKQVNAYVGGDAYNYIINSNYATGYFVLTAALILAAVGCGIMWNFFEIRIQLQKNSILCKSNLLVDDIHVENI